MQWQWTKTLTATMEQWERRDRAMRRSPINQGEPIDDVCRCYGDLSDDEMFDETLDGDFDEDPCHDCGGRVVSSSPPVWIEEEEDDC